MDRWIKFTIIHNADAEVLSIENGSEGEVASINEAILANVNAMTTPLAGG